MVNQLTEGEHNAQLARLQEEYDAQPKIFKTRVKAWMLRLQGYQPAEIATACRIELPTVYKYLRWARDNLPSAIDGAEDFIRVSYDRLEIQYRQLERGRAEGNELAHRVSVSIIDQQAKLLGIYTMKLDLTAKVNYAIEGVDMGQV
jgi:Putative ATPase subunit of terminase (gpP-like).